MFYAGDDQPPPGLWGRLGSSIKRRWTLLKIRARGALVRFIKRRLGGETKAIQVSYRVVSERAEHRAVGRVLLLRYRPNIMGWFLRYPETTMMYMSDHPDEWKVMMGNGHVLPEGTCKLFESLYRTANPAPLDLDKLIGHRYTPDDRQESPFSKLNLFRDSVG